MVEVFTFPDVGEGLHEGDIVRWLVHEGDMVKTNQPLVEMETAKAIVEIPSPHDGIVLRLHGKEGDTIKVGSPLVTFGKEGEKLEGAAPSKTVAPKKENPKMETAPQAQVSSGMILATPHTRRLAREKGVDLSLIAGTGREGRITDADIEAAAGKTSTPQRPRQTFSQPSVSSDPAREERVQVKGLRKTIAEAMTRSKFTAPHVTHMDEADVTDLIALRKKEMKSAEALGVKLTYLPFIAKAIEIALKLHPYLNSSFDDERQEIILKHYYNFGIAVDTPEGLIVPVIQDIDRKSIMDLAKEFQEVAQLARARKLSREHLHGGTFTITNIGSLGGTGATPIINHPEVAIMGVFAIKEKPVVKDGTIMVRHILPLALSFDHRVLDGGEAARFMQDVIRHLEDPALLLLDVV